jgi:ketosteroid isomerase-like protein
VSEENVEIVRRLFEASLRHDNETALSLYDAEVTVETDFLDTPGVFHGVDGVREWYQTSLDVLADVATTVYELIDAGDDVIVILRLAGRGRRSGVPVERQEAHIWTVRDGKLWRLRVFRTRTEALKAVGLEE